MPDARVLPAWEPYRPSNGTEGLAFREAWCDRCRAQGSCTIADAAFYGGAWPQEWRGQADDQTGETARCTAFEPKEG